MIDIIILIVIVILVVIIILIVIVILIDINILIVIVILVSSVITCSYPCYMLPHSFPGLPVVRSWVNNLYHVHFYIPIEDAAKTMLPE